jgi:hypothetical protein
MAVAWENADDELQTVAGKLPCDPNPAGRDVDPAKLAMGLRAIRQYMDSDPAVVCADVPANDNVRRPAGRRAWCLEGRTRQCRGPQTDTTRLGGGRGRANG